MRDYSWVILGKATSAAAQVYMLFVLAAGLEPGKLAVLLGMYSLSSVVASMGDLGLGTLALRERSYGNDLKADQALRTADRLASFTATIGVTVVGIASTFVLNLMACIPLLMWAPAERATESRMLSMLASGKSRTVALLNAGRRVSAVVLFMALTSLMQPAFAFTLSLAAASCATYVLVKKLHPTSSRAHVIPTFELLREAFPFTLTSVAGQMRNLDVPIISFVLGGVPAAAYGLGARMASPVMLVFSAVSGLLLARARAYSFRRILALLGAVLFLAVFLTLIVFGLLPVAEPVLSLYINWIDPQAVFILACVASSYIFAGTGIIFGSLCVAFRLQKRLVRTNIITVVVSLASILIATVVFENAAAAAVGALICYAAQSVLLASTIAYFVISKRWS